ncbi:hypothetical protein SAMN05660284_02545 [Formivibrio citricus]|uniref:UPF0235 protein SAMN05660284_02545 n=1 Tax=Formivibrio citricus TaxID=83765 RepID=A0A1I5D161_9NEIS|nr:DUF167 domain-containing protein [Formivibrio citricus]SFN92866.1 hypothetical protein SAMN05660284_02545 [Formivibrio citricus]
MDWFTLTAERITLHLHVQPGAKKTEVAGLHGDCLKIRLAAPPVDGKANECLLRALANWFDVPLRQVSLKSGETSRRKVVEICGSRKKPEELLNE